MATAAAWQPRAACERREYAGDGKRFEKKQRTTSEQNVEQEEDVPEKGEESDQEEEFQLSTYESDYTRHCLTWLAQQEALLRHVTDIALYVLGTGSKAPMQHRGLASYAFIYKDFHALVDCGEGTQVRLALSRLSTCWFTHIFITHLHGDHIFGLPGVILNIVDSGLPERLPIRIFGPPGLRLWLEHTLRVSAAIDQRQFVVYEMHTAPSNHRHEDDIFPTPDGTWHLMRNSDVEVKAREIEHSTKCWGFVFEEQAPRGRFDVKKADALGIPRGPMRGALTRGEEVVSPVTGEKVTQEDVCDPDKPTRKIVILGDTCNATSMIPLGLDADILVHECTLANKDQRKARPRGHSTPRIAAALARSMRAKNLVLSHFSQRFFTPELVEHDIGHPVRQQLARTAVNVIAGSDLMRLVLHRRGRDRGEPVEEPPVLPCNED